LKQRQSARTIALWVFLIVIFFAIYQTASRTGDGQRMTLSQFISQALPAADGTGAVRSGRLAHVVVHGEGLEYALRPPGQRLAAAQDKAQKGPAEIEPPIEAPDDSMLEWYNTRGDVKMPLGGRGNLTVLSALSQRGVRVTFEDAGNEARLRGLVRPFSIFLAEVQRLRPPTNVVRIKIRGKEILGEMKSGERFVTVGELGDYRQALIERGVEVTEENDQESSLWLSVLGTWLPMILIFAIFFIFMRQLQAGGGKAMSFGKSRAKLLNEATNKITFADIAGINEAKEELQEIIQFLKDPKKFTRLGGRIPKGVLLMGPPGTGKTLLAKGVAGEAGVPFYTISGSDFVEMFVGVGASRVRDLFEQGKKNAPCIIFIDEIDAVGRHRGAGLGGGHDEREQTLNQLLVEMDGFESNEGVILIAATNRPDVLDPALLRPGRFDRRVMVQRPDIKGREAILTVHTVKTRLSSNVDLQVIARGTPGFSGADLANLVNEGALLAARRDKDSIDMTDLEDAKDKVLMGAERRSMVVTEEDRRVTAVHEAGHTIVAARVPGNDPIHKVTIIPRGMALGLTWTLPAADQHNLREEQVIARITMAMGGRVAEELTFGSITTGAGNDIEQATKLARKMVCEWGMSKLGPISLKSNDGNVFLGKDIGRASEFSQSTQGEADGEIRRILDEGYARATQVIQEHQEGLGLLTDALLEFESIDGKEVELVLSGNGLRAIRELRAEAVDRQRAEAEAAKDSEEIPPLSPDLPSSDGVVPSMPEPEGAMRSRIDHQD
jgi:cell division protease FtsH